MSIGTKKDWDEYLQERLCNVPLGMKAPTPPTLVVTEDIIESPVDLVVSASKKEQTLPAIEGFAPLILSLLGIVKLVPGFVQKGTPIILVIRGFNPFVLPKPIQGIFEASGLKTLEATLPNPIIISPKMLFLAPNL